MNQLPRFAYFRFMESLFKESTGIERINEVFKTQQQTRELLRAEPVSNRKIRLKKLGHWIKTNRNQIQEAIYADFRKPAVETDATEIFAALNEVAHTLSNLDRWTKPKKIDAPITMLGTRSCIMYEPKGVCLIISPWNYPFNLSVGPLVSALAAGNSAIIKPSELTPHTSSLIARMCRELFDESIVAVCEGGPETAQHLLTLPFDHIFFTGSPAVGKVVMKAAAENLASITLELGGKSPVIVTPSARIKEAARRIAVAKFINNGQTCIAPDYLLVHESVVADLITALKKEVHSLFSEPGKPLQQSPHYARVVSPKHFNRLNALIQDAVEKGASVEMSGAVEADSKFIHPIILTNVQVTSRIMEEEIFGPVLPVLTYRLVNEAITFVNERPKPLALYVFGSNPKETKDILASTSSGGVCINDCAIHFLHHNLPFGGVNNSGIGKSHGYYGFLAFSNEKPVLRQRNGVTSVQFFYPPYTNRVKKIMNWLIRFI